jgi:hypothetical protein
MNEKSNNTIEDQKKEVTAPVNESGGFCFSSSIKISDPNTKEVLLQMRGDN